LEPGIRIRFKSISIWIHLCPSLCPSQFATIRTYLDLEPSSAKHLSTKTAIPSLHDHVTPT
jgi:hypothetical protein